jgi:hypothetical protein
MFLSIVKRPIPTGGLAGIGRLEKWRDLPKDDH